MTTFYIVRHGESKANIGISDSNDSDLTDLGIEQSKKLSFEFVNIHFDAVFSSNLIRAKRTAELVTKSLSVKTIPILSEVEITNSSKVNKKTILTIMSFLREVSLKYSNKMVLIISHSVIMSLLLFNLKYTTREEIYLKGFINTGYMIIENIGNEFKIIKTEGLKIRKV